jgi:hypothetical protein
LKVKALCANLIQASDQTFSVLAKDYNQEELETKRKVEKK